MSRRPTRPPRLLLLPCLLGASLAACGQAPGSSGAPSAGAAPALAPTAVAAGGIRYNGIFVKSSLPFRSVTGWAPGDLVAENSRLTAQGYAMTDLSAFVLPGDQIRYNAIWKKGPATDRRWVAGWRSTDFWKRYNELNAQGYCLDVLGAFSDSAWNDFWYNAIWTRCGVKPSFTPSLEFQWLAGDVAAMAAQGRHLRHLNSRFQNGRQLYTALYTPQSGPQPWVAGWTQGDLAGEVARLQGQGYALRDLQATVLSGNQVRFDAVWTRSATFRPARWNSTPADFQAETGRLAAQGYVPLTISAFVMPP